MSIDDLVPKILIERYGKHSRNVIRSLIYRIFGVNYGVNTRVYLSNISNKI